MLRLLAEKCTDVLLRHGTIEQSHYAVYIYGFELFWSTSLCLLSILGLGLLFGYLPQAVVFILCFMPIRTVAGGYHAGSYGMCFLLTNLIAAACTRLGLLLWSLGGQVALLCLCALAFAYIWREAPVVSKTHPLKERRIVRNRRYAHILLGVETIALLSAGMLACSSLVCTAAVTSCAVAVMILIAEKGEK